MLKILSTWTFPIPLDTPVQTARTAIVQKWLHGIIRQLDSWVPKKDAEARD